MDKSLDIEKIIMHKFENNRRLFLVKFKGYEIYTWLPLIDIEISSYNLIMDYFISKKIKTLPPLSIKQRAKNLYNMLASISEEDLNIFVQQFDNFILPKSKLDILMQDLESLIDVNREIELNEKQIQQLRERVLTEICIQRRSEQLIKLQEQEWMYNRICDNRVPLKICNNRDFAILPEYLTYVNEYIASDGIYIPCTPPEKFFGCGSTNSFKKHKCSKSCACMALFEVTPAYNKEGLLSLNRRKAIHECNKMCNCDEDCRYRVVQRGCNVKLLIFRTATGTGWGIKTLEFLPKGTFIGRYVGKVIPWEEGELLSKSNGREQYLFDIDCYKMDNGHSKYTVDAYYYGNFTRFINHSCEPNLTVFNVWINSLDNNLHEIAFFTKRNVANGEELTFNYRKVFKYCKCGSFQCKPQK
ncbi:hypothetical protein PGB90_006707 [Kerria lacca]